jgi:hypothetical protein
VPVYTAGVWDVAGVVPGSAAGALRLAAGVRHLHPRLPPPHPVARAAGIEFRLKNRLLGTLQVAYGW